MRSYFIVFIIYMIGIPLLSQEVWDLEQCLSYALEHSLDLQQSDYALDDATIQSRINRSQQYPNLSFSSNAFWNTGRTIDPTTNEFNNTTFFSNGLQINSGVLLYNGGRIKKNIAQGYIDESVTKEDRSAMANTITLNVISAYFEVLFAKDNLANSEVQLNTINDQIDQMKKLIAAGSRAQFEIYDLESQQATSEQEITLGQNRIELALLNLKGILNLSPSFDLDVASPPVEQKVYSDPDLSSFDEILERVVQSRPEMRAFDLRIESAALGVEIAESQLYPSLTFGINFSTNFSNRSRRVSDGTIQTFSEEVFINGNPATIGRNQFVPTDFSTIPYFNQFGDNKSVGFGFNATLPIYSNYNTKGSIERNKLNVLNQKIEKEKYSVELRNTLGKLITDVKAAKRNLTAANKVLQAREISFINAQKRFNLGAINSFDFTSIQDQLYRARTEQILAKYDYMLKAKVLDFYQGYPVSLK